MVEKYAIRILMLDDEPFMLKLLGRMLANLGFTQVTSCDNGRAALTSFDSPNNPPELILLDINMPEMDGVEFVRHLVERLYTGSLILISGEDERMLQVAVKLVRAHKIPVLGHLRKPVKPESLSALLEKWTPSSSARPGAVKKVYGADELRAAIANGELVITSPRWRSPRVRSWAWRPWCAGVTPRTEWCSPTSLLAWRKRTA